MEMGMDAGLRGLIEVLATIVEDTGGHSSSRTRRSLGESTDWIRDKTALFSLLPVTFLSWFMRMVNWNW